VSTPIIKAAAEKRAAKQADLELLLVEPTTDKRSLTDDETASFEAIEAEIRKLDAQIEMLTAEEARKAEAATAAAEVVAEAPVASAPAVVRSEPMTYNEHSQASYLRDMVALQVPQAGFNTEDARERMARHAREVEVEARTNKDLAKRLDSVQRELRATNNYDTNGGDLVPPLYLIDSWVPAFRPGRIVANRVTQLELPGGTDSVRVPKITTGTTAYAQGAASSGSAGNASLSSTDLTTSTATAAVNTYYGQLEASLQLLEQSPVNGGVDQVIFADLQAAYDQKLDAAILTGSGSSGEHQGILTYAATSAVSATAWTYTGASTLPFSGSVGGVFPSIVKAVNAVETSRYAPPTAMWVHPRRANSFGVAADTQNRPVFVKTGNGPFNAFGTGVNSPVAQGLAGELYGLPVIKDAAIPTAYNSTTSAYSASSGTQDVICIVRESDLFLWEGPTRLRALPEVSSGTLGVRFQLFAYSAFMPDRVSSAINIVTGPALQALGF